MAKKGMVNKTKMEDLQEKLIGDLKTTIRRLITPEICERTDNLLAIQIKVYVGSGSVNMSVNVCDALGYQKLFSDRFSVGPKN